MIICLCLLNTSCHNGIHGLFLLGCTLISDKSAGLKLDKALGLGVGLALEVPELVPLEDKPSLLPGLDAPTLLGAETLLIGRLQTCNTHTKFFKLEKKEKKKGSEKEKKQKTIIYLKKIFTLTDLDIYMYILMYLFCC